jgi:hypothetical protein
MAPPEPVLLRENSVELVLRRLRLLRVLSLQRLNLELLLPLRRKLRVDPDLFFMMRSAIPFTSISNSAVSVLIFFSCNSISS